MLLRVLDDYAAAHPEAARVGIGDLSRPHGGVFDKRFGGLGHASHQNGRDVDVYYPRLDREELAPARPSQIDRALAQDLVTRFVHAGAVKVFVGPHTGLRGPTRIVQRLIYHDDHMHVRIGPDPKRQFLIGRSVKGRPIEAVRVGDRSSEIKALVVGCIHGNECAGTAVARILARSSPEVDLWLVPNLNPDGLAPRHRQNAHGVDLNRNFPSEWKRGGRPWDAEYPGPKPLSEPETRSAARLIRRVKPSVTIWFHQPRGSCVPGTERPRSAPLRRARGDEVRADSLAAGLGAELAEPRLPGNQLVCRRASGRDADGESGRSSGARRSCDPSGSSARTVGSLHARPRRHRP